MNFSDMLQALKVSDEALEADIELGENVMDKVDSIKYVLDKLEHEVTHLDFMLVEIEGRKKRLQKNHEHLKNFIVQSMQSAQSEMAAGHNWHVKLVKNPPRVVTTRPPTTEDYIENSDAVRMKIDYAWEKEYLKNHIDDEKIKQIAKIETGFRPKFTMRIP